MTDTIQLLRELLAKTTPVPWEIHNGNKHPHIKSAGGMYIMEYQRGARLHSDAELIVAAINALPALLEVAEAAKSWGSAYKGEISPSEIHFIGENLVKAVDALAKLEEGKQ